MTVLTRARAHAAAFIGIALWLVTVAAQDVLPPTSSRAMTARLGAPGIDRGLRPGGEARRVRKASDLPARRAGDGERFVRGSVIVKFRSGTSAATEAAIRTLVRGHATAPLSYASFQVMALDQDADPEAVAQRLAAQPDVEYAQARYRVRPLFTPNDPLYSLQWNFPALDMERAWEINRGASPEIVVAVLDTGIAYRNISFDQPTIAQTIDNVFFPALGTVHLTFAAAPELGSLDRFVAPHDFIWDDSTPVDMDGHGTHVAGTIAQVTNNATGVAGMAFNVKLMPVKVLDGFWDAYFGSPYFGTDDTIARGIRYAVDSGANVINMSIGRTGPPAPAVREAFSYAVSRGVFVAVAGGNEFFEGNPVGRFAELAPQTNGVVSVAAIARDRTRASYSSTGPYIELAAPGGDSTRSGVTGMIVQQTYDFDFTDTFFNGATGFRAPRFDVFEYIYYEGTSMATAHVSGLAALLLQQGITKPAAIEAAMKAFATDLGAPGRDDQYGYGLINPRAALRGSGVAR
jgi:serine protease